MAKNTRLVGTPKVGGGTSRRMRRWQGRDKIQIQKSVRLLKLFPKGRMIKPQWTVDCTYLKLGVILKNPQRPGMYMRSTRMYNRMDTII